MHMDILNIDTCLSESGIIKTEVEIDGTLRATGTRSRHQFFPRATLAVFTPHLGIIATSGSATVF